MARDRAPRHAAYYVEQLRELMRLTRAASRAHGAPTRVVARRARRLRAEHGFEYDEAAAYGLLDPAVPEETLAEYASWTRARRVQERLNPGDVKPVTDEKTIFYRLCELMGLPHPRVYGTVGAHSSGRSHTGRLLCDGADFAAFVLQDLPDEWVVKPSDGHYGNGVRVLERRGDGLVDAVEGPLTPAELHGRLLAAPHATWVVQERLHNHPRLAELARAPALHTARIVTYVDRAGGVTVLGGRLRLGLDGGVTDNYRGGRTGNVAAAIRVADGRVGLVERARPDGLGTEVGPSLPDGCVVEGWRLPDWEATVALVRRAAEAFLPARALGWDVAFTPGGPVLVEANPSWEPWPGRDMGRAVARMEAEAAGA